MSYGTVRRHIDGEVLSGVQRPRMGTSGKVRFLKETHLPGISVSRVTFRPPVRHRWVSDFA
jgi:hypothetical protein